MNRNVLACRVVGHKLRFTAHGRTMTWECERCADEYGLKEYDTAEDARRYAAAFDRRDVDDLGRRAPLIGLFPLRLWHKLRSPRHKRL